jgi:c(7)-type cytochrome triheme protein
MWEWARRVARRRAAALWWAMWLPAVALVAATGLVSCKPESRYRVLAFLFEDAPEQDPGAAPVVRSPRHPPPPTPTPTSTPAAVAAGGAPTGLMASSTWEDVARLLPKDQMGNPDWVAALNDKVIAPRPGIAPETPEPEVLSLDIDLIPKTDRAFAVTFSHRTHGGWLSCRNCHTELFEMKTGATAMTPDDVHTGRRCAACHGKVAFDVVTGCPLCHLRSLPKDAGGRVDWNRALAEKLIAPRPGRSATSPEQRSFDLDVELGSKTQPTVKSVFSHSTHTQWLACANCHPRLFPMGVNAAGLSGADLHSRRYCGACHGSVAFGIIGACERCHPTLAKVRQHQDVLDLDVEVTPASQASSKTVFSHRTHRFVDCPSCHTDLFEQPAGAKKMTMADISEGKYCAGCHGKVAVDLVAQCQHCHATLSELR